VINTQHNYIDFHDFKSIAANEHVLDNLVHTYRSIFSDPELWDEQYTVHEVINNLEDDLSGDAAIRLCMNNDEVLGFCWAQRLSYEHVEQTINSIRYYQELGRPDIRNILRKIIGDEPVIYLHELGVSIECRGQVALHNLICPVLISLSERTKTDRVFFWSIENTRVFKLAERAGFRLAATDNKMQFFIGELKTSENS